MIKINEIIGNVYDLKNNKILSEKSELNFDSIIKTSTTGYINLSVGNKEITLLGDDTLSLNKFTNTTKNTENIDNSDTSNTTENLNIIDNNLLDIPNLILDV
nr:MAG TPA: hypothetical protein [Caudoviricetes sp.]